MDLCRFGISHASPENPSHSFRGRFGGFAAVDDVISDEVVVCLSLFKSFSLLTSDFKEGLWHVGPDLFARQKNVDDLFDQQKGSIFKVSTGIALTNA